MGERFIPRARKIGNNLLVDIIILGALPAKSQMMKQIDQEPVHPDVLLNIQ